MTNVWGNQFFNKINEGLIMVALKSGCYQQKLRHNKKE